MGKDIFQSCIQVFQRDRTNSIRSLPLTTPVCCCSVTKSCSTLRPRGMQHARQLCPPLSPGDCSNSCPLSRCYYLTISLSSTLFSFCLRSFPASESFPMSQLFASGGHSIGVSAPALVLPMNIQGWFPLESSDRWSDVLSIAPLPPCWFPLGLTGLISLKSKGLSRVFSSTTLQKHRFFSAQPSLWSNSHSCTWLLEKP